LRVWNVIQRTVSILFRIDKQASERRQKLQNNPEEKGYEQEIRDSWKAKKLSVEAD
jgi:hypothetical protein